MKTTNAVSRHVLPNYKLRAQPENPVSVGVGMSCSFGEPLLNLLFTRDAHNLSIPGGLSSAALLKAILQTRQQYKISKDGTEKHDQMRCHHH
jgi:hypothetical protein